MSDKDRKVVSYFFKQRGDKLKETILTQNLIEEPVALEQGPLVKNNSTVLLQTLIKAFMENKIDPNKPAVNFCIENNKIYATYNEEKYDVSEAIYNTNMNHLSFDDQDTDNYMRLIQSKAFANQPYIPEKYGIIPTMEDYEKAEEKCKYPDAVSMLNWAEKTAINIYTGPTYKGINKMLRGDIEHFQTKQSDVIGEVLATAAMACMGLNKVSESTPCYSYRTENFFSEEHITRLVNAVNAVNAGGMISQEAAFFSSSANLAYDMSDMFEYGDLTGYLLTDLRGKYVAGISQTPQEAEYLIPPTQIQYLGYYRMESGSYIF